MCNELANEGLGPGRARVRVVSIRRILASRLLGPRIYDASGFRDDAESAHLRLSLAPCGFPVTKLLLRFLTPTEMKHQGNLVREPRFDVILARAHDRIAALARFYQDVPFDLDFRELAQRSRAIRLVRAQTTISNFERLSRSKVSALARSTAICPSKALATEAPASPSCIRSSRWLLHALRNVSHSPPFIY
jgi:hypothetical protein